MTQPPGGDPYLRPPPPQRPYGAPPGYQPPPPGYVAHGAPAPQHPQSGFQPPPGYGWQQQPTAPDGSPLASPWLRLAARFVDGFIVNILSIPFALPLYIAYFRHILDKLKPITDAARTGEPAPANVNIYDATTIKLLALILLVSLVVAFVYEVTQLAIWGQTVGKRICRIRVVRMDGPPRLGFGTAVLRWIGSYAGNFVPFLGSIYAFLDCLWLLWDKPYQQCLHDKFAKTVVVRLPQ